MPRRLFVFGCVFCATYMAALLIHRTPPTAAQSPTEFHYLPQIANDYCGPFLDPFDDNVAFWFTGHADGLRAEIVGGEYRLAFSGLGGEIWFVPAPVCPRGSYQAAVDVRWAGATGNFIGLLFNLDEAAGRAHLFAVNTDARVWLVFEVHGDNLDIVIPPTAHDAILPGNAANRLAVGRAGDRITLRINDTAVGELIVVLPGAPVLAGVAAASYTTQSSADARFDNFFWSDE